MSDYLQLVDVPLFTEEEIAQVEDMIAEGWVDPMEMEEPHLNSEAGFDQEFLLDCN